MGFQELEAAWAEYQPRVTEDYRDWDRRREETAPLYLDALGSFLAGDVDVQKFRTEVDLLSRANPFFGFKGTSQMFFNQLVNGGAQEAVEEALKAVLPAPADEDDALRKLESFVVTVEAAREHAETIGASKPGIGRIDAFVSTFWEFDDRDAWPALYPNSRRVLAAEGLLDESLPQPQLYLAFRERIQELKERLGTTTWNVEHLLWELRESEDEDGGEGGAEGDGPEVEPAATDLYDHYLRKRIYLPDHIVTSFVLSLKTKPFVILSGISGTGKTKIAQELARYLEAQAGETATTVETPQPGPQDIFVKLTAAQLERGFGPVSDEARRVIEASLRFPERGESIVYPVRVPSGSIEEIRISNYDFTDKSRELYRMLFRGDLRSWIKDHVKPGAVIRLRMQPGREAEMELSLESGVSLPEETQEDRYVLVPVKSDWTDPRGLIGFFNPITRRYVTTELVDLLVRADSDREHPYLVILDEMNLARVEYYFSDFLSVLESGESLRLMTEAEAKESAAGEEDGSETDELPDQLEIPPNVRFVGTVNIDETTHPLSPKVLDRANVIEFNTVDLDRALGQPGGSAESGLRLAPGLDIATWLREGEVGTEAARALAHGRDDFTDAVRAVHGILARWDLQFGYRVIDEMSAFVGYALAKGEGDPDEIVRESFDLQLKQKVIPKLSGGREMEEPLAALLAFALSGATEAKSVAATLDDARKALAGGAGAPLYPKAAAKLFRMLRRLGDTGFVGALE